MRYSVQQRYTARRDGVTYGPWSEGETVDLDPEVAAWINRDAPGTLALPAPKQPERAQPRPADRRHSAGRDRGR